jgi:flagellar biosynthesis protein FlhF
MNLESRPAPRQPTDAAWPDLRREPAPLLRAPLAPDELIGLPLEPGTRDVAERLLAHGASPDFARLVLGEVLRRGARGAYAIDAAAAVLARALPILPSPKRPRRNERPPLFAFVGPTGVGKTAALVKLGRKLREAGRKVLFASLDPLSLEAFERVGGLASDVDRGEIPLALVRTSDDLKRLVRRAGALDTVLLDTPGLSPRDDLRLDELARELANCTAACEAETLLVLAATAGRGALQLATRAFARFRPDGAVVTKLDETDEPGAALEALVRARLPVAFLCDGQDARAHLLRPSAEALADLALRGHLAGGAA